MATITNRKGNAMHTYFRSHISTNIDRALQPLIENYRDHRDAYHDLNDEVMDRLHMSTTTIDRWAKRRDERGMQAAEASWALSRQGVNTDDIDNHDGVQSPGMFSGWARYYFDA